MGNAGVGPPPPPPPPGRRRTLARLRGRGAVLMLIGGLLIGGGLGVAVSFAMVLLVVQLFANIFTVPFTQELRWYGPGIFDWDPDFRNAVLAATTLGSVLLVLGAVRRYGAQPSPPPA